MMNTTVTQAAPGNTARRPSNLFYVTRLRRPLVDRAEGIYIWTQTAAVSSTARAGRWPSISATATATCWTR